MSAAHVVIVALCISVILCALFLIFTRSILTKLNITTVFRLPIPIVLIMLVVLFGIFSVAASRPIVCGSCHVMRPAVAQWSVSSHRTVSCLGCHKKASVLAIPISNLEAGRMTLHSISGNYKLPLSSAVNNQSCLSCHDAIKRGVQTKFQTMMSHAEVIQAGISCLECHSGVAHKQTERIGTSMMETCSGCHNDEIASSRCPTCHLSNVWLGMKPTERSGIIHDSAWPKTHGSRSLYMCKSCHAEKDCTRCHATIVPHPEGWPYIHGQEARKTPDDCAICHTDSSFCKDCHRIQMPHPPGWLSIHKISVEVSGQDICKQCHPVADCRRCHDRHEKDASIMRKGGKR